MSVKYRYGHRPGRRRRTRVLIVLVVSFVILVIVGGIIAYDVYKNRSKSTTGTPLTVIQTFDNSPTKRNIDEPTFSMELPGDWKEIARVNNSRERYVTWQATQKNNDNRYLTVHVDIIPGTKAINRLLPIMAQANTITFGDVSDNCATFTGGGTLDVSRAIDLEPKVAKWQGVDFICNLPNVVDNEVGTGSQEGINTLTVIGTTKGPHRYFFLYIDRNIQPNYNILFDALRSFKAK